MAHTLMNPRFHIFTIIMSLMGLAGVFTSNQAQADDLTRFQWRAVSVLDNSQSSWTEGSFANLGFTQDTLEFTTSTAPHSDETLYLLLSPVYLDHLDLVIEHGSGNTTFQLGDKQTESDSQSVMRLPGKLAVALPDEVRQISTSARSASNLRLKLEIVNESSLASQSKSLVFGATALLTLLTLSFFAAILIWSVNRSPSLFYFSFYQLSWSALLSGILYPIFPGDLWSLETNDKLVSFSALLATLTGALTHAEILNEFARARMASRILRIVALGAALLLGIFLSGHHLMALRFNILLISTVPLIILAIILFDKTSRAHSTAWLQIRLGYLVLMGSVLLTGLSGLGIGQLFEGTYVHALITTLILSVILFVGIRNRNRLARAKLQKMELESSQKVLVENQLKENIVMFEMLSHEIKTPLTTLSMMLHKAENRARAGRQIDAIRTIIEQTGLALNLQPSNQAPSRINLKRAIMENWQLLSTQCKGQLLDVRISKNYWVLADNYLFDILIRNILNNALKYSVSKSKVQIYTLIRGSHLVLVVSNQSRITYQKDTSWFTKYWRAEEAKSVRGTGLGLWIVKRISDLSSFEVRATARPSRFRIILCINNFGEI